MAIQNFRKNHFALEAVPVTLRMAATICLNFFVLIDVLPDKVTCETVDLKIVDEPSSFGSVGGYQYGDASHLSQPVLRLRVQPANFSGPPHLKRLLNKCYSSVISGYKYNFCPFHNVTQHEQGIHWNPYNGVLGVWQEWSVVNNTFSAMMMRDGESCGEIYRSVMVTFQCGNTSQILNVTEPNRCQYHLQFQTPLVCHADSMLVYPTLSQELRHRWDAIEGEMVRGELTQKGYNKRLQLLFEKAGIYLTQEGHTDLVKKAEESKKEKMKDGDFDTLDSCKAEYKKLQEEVKSLMSQLGLGGDSSPASRQDLHLIPSEED